MAATQNIEEFRNCLIVFMCSLILRGSRCAEMAGNLRQVRLGVVRVRVELRAESAHNFTNGAERQLIEHALFHLHFDYVT